MIAYTITSSNKVWMIDDTKDGMEIPPWCHNKDGYYVVEELPQDVLDLVNYTRELEAMDKQKRDIDSAIENHLDDTASLWGYKNIDRVISYINSTNEEWQSEAVKFQSWRDAVWAYVLAEMIRVENGEREIPTADEVIIELPKLEDF